MVFMIEAHVFNSFSTSAIESREWYSYLSFVNGLVAPAFLWIAGFLAGKSALKVQIGSHWIKRWKRCAEIWLLGAIMHAPLGHWLEGDFSSASWRAFFQINILQCMGLSLGAIYLIGYLGKALPRKVTLGIFVVLMLGCVFFAQPLAEAYGIAPWLGLLVSEKSGSLFPWLPWLGFALAGACSSILLWTQGVWVKAGVGIFLLCAGMYFEPEVFSKSHFAFFAERLGYVLILATSLEFFFQNRSCKSLQHIGQHSLSYYVAHLAFLYFVSIKGQTLYQKWENQLSLLQCFWLYLGIVLLCVVAVGIYLRVADFLTRWFQRQ